MQQPSPARLVAILVALLTKNATIFWEHEVLYIVVIATRQFIFFLYFFSKNCENNGENISFNLSFIDKF